MRIKHVIAGGMAAALAAVALGPRVKTQEPEFGADVPDDLSVLDDWLSASESRVANITSGTDKTIIWANGERKQTEIAVVYLHGFTATRQETAPLSDLVAEALGANLFYTRLTGHGLPGKALGAATVTDWLDDTIEAMTIATRLGKRVVLIGMSTGGTLATWLATRPDYAELIDALVLISPNFGPAQRGADLMLLPWGMYLAETVLGNEQRWTPSNERHGRFWTNRYPTRALLPMMGLVKLVRSKRLESVRTPVFMAYSSHDRVIDVKRAAHHFGRLGSREKVMIDLGDVNATTDHVLAGEILAPGTTGPLSERIVQFVRSLAKAT